MATRKKAAVAVNTHSRAHLHQSTTLGDHLAESVATTMGSWRFIIIQTCAVFLWLLLNITGFILRWDPFPFILLNLMFSVQAAYTGPILQMTGNRAAAISKLRDDHEAKEVDELFKIQLEQVKILNGQNTSMALQTEILNFLRTHIPQTHHPDLTPLLPFTSGISSANETIPANQVNTSRSRSRKGTTTHAE